MPSTEIPKPTRHSLVKRTHRTFGTLPANQGNVNTDRAVHRLRIAQVSPLYESVPPRRYGGTERVVCYLTEELVRLGHRVTLFASGDSVTSAELVPIVPKSLRLDERVRDCMPYNCILVDRVMRRAHEFDILHFHVEFFHYPFGRALASRMLRQAAGGRRDDGARGLEGEELERQRRAVHHLLPAAVIGAGRDPVPPIGDGLLEQLLRLSG